MEQTLNLILSELQSVRKELKEIGQEVSEIKQSQVSMENKLTERLDLLTNQTSNAIIEHHDKSIDFLRGKIIKLEEELYKLKQN